MHMHTLHACTFSTFDILEGTFQSLMRVSMSLCVVCVALCLCQQAAARSAADTVSNVEHLLGRAKSFLDLCPPIPTFTPTHPQPSQEVFLLPPLLFPLALSSI